MNNYLAKYQIDPSPMFRDENFIQWNSSSIVRLNERWLYFTHIYKYS